MPKTKALKHLEELLLAESKEKYPNLPDHCRTVNTFTTVANKESKQIKRIETFFRLMPKAKMNRIDNKGTRIDNRKRMYNPLGADQTVGSVQYRPSQMQNGLADLVGLIDGRYIAMELKRVYKNGKDRQSKVQKDFQREVEAAGGVYVIVDSFEDAYKWYFNFVNK